MFVIVSHIVGGVVRWYGVEWNGLDWNGGWTGLQRDGARVAWRGSQCSRVCVILWMQRSVTLQQSILEYHRTVRAAPVGDLIQLAVSL